MKRLLTFTLCLALGIIGYSALSVRQKPRLQMECMSVLVENPDGSTSAYDCADPRVMERLSSDDQVSSGTSPDSLEDEQPRRSHDSAGMSDSNVIKLPVKKSSKTTKTRVPVKRQR